jgi:hypothetical protein
MELFSGELSDGATTNRFNHRHFLSCRNNKRFKSVKARPTQWLSMRPICKILEIPIQGTLPTAPPPSLIVTFVEFVKHDQEKESKFGYAELYVGRGVDEGILIPAARVRLRDGNTWEVEDFGTYSARLMGLKVRRGGKEDIQ